MDTSVLGSVAVLQFCRLGQFAMSIVVQAAVALVGRFRFGGRTREEAKALDISAAKMMRMEERMVTPVLGAVAAPLVVVS